MYTGIVQGKFPLAKVEKKPGLHSLFIELPSNLMEDLTMGASVAMDGVCLTVAGMDGGSIRFDVMQETLTKTILMT